MFGSVEMGPRGERGPGDSLVFEACGLAIFAPLASALKLAKRERLFAIAALALDLSKPRVFTGAESSDVGRDNAIAKFDGAIAVGIAKDFVGGNG